jgi:hypothetical protein
VIVTRTINLSQSCDAFGLFRREFGQTLRSIREIDHSAAREIAPPLNKQQQ